MIQLDISTEPELYVDYLKGVEFLKQLNFDNFNYPSEITYFHVYSEIKNEKELECVKSYFATQNLEKTKLVLWSDFDISNQQNIAPYKDLIDFRVYSPIEESKGTIMEGQTERLLAKDSKHYLQSDLLRILALHKYGGIWIDMDVILLRDFKPILDQEFFYQWGGDTDFSNLGCCGTVMSLKKNSELSTKLLTQLINTPVVGNTTIWGKDLFAHVYRSSKFTIFPSTFFNIEWLMSKIDKKLSEDILEFWFENECPDNLLFTECFAWHWHNSSNKNKQTVDKSKFGKLKKITEHKLLENGLGF